MSFLAELQRRNVIRMAGLYLVGAWLIVQVASTLFPAFELPGWALRGVILLLAIGFVPALVFSWLYELTPSGLKRDSEVAPGESISARTAGRMDRLIFAGLVALIVVIAADRWWPRAAPAVAVDTSSAVADAKLADSALPAQPAAAATPVDPNSIAVLPFVNMSADAENEFFSDGISEELLNVLAKVEGLSVAARSSAFAFKGREMGAAAIGGELKVAHVLEGSVRKSGKRVRITAQLIDARSDRQLWSETFDRELDDIFAIQDEIARAIVAALRATLGERATAVAVRADTDNLDAYALYLKARELFLARSELDESVRLYEQVVALDPGFARGWEGLAAASVVSMDWQTAPLSAAEKAARLARSEEAATRALALDPALSLPWGARALALLYGSPIDYHRALSLLARALEAEPRNANAYLWRGLTWVRLGFFEHALADLDHCLAIDPAYGNCLRWKALVLLYQSRTDAALALFEQGMAQGFNANRGNSFVEPLIRRGDVFSAILLMRELQWPVEAQQVIVAALRDGKPPGDVAALVRRYPEVPWRQYTWGLLLRDYALAADAGELRSTHVEHWDPAFEGLRNSAAFKHILERFDVLAYWRAHGYPPQCRALGRTDFECDDPGAAH